MAWAIQLDEPTSIKVKLVLNGVELPVMSELPMETFTSNDRMDFFNDVLGGNKYNAAEIPPFLTVSSGYSHYVHVGPFTPPGATTDGTGLCLLLIDPTKIVAGLLCFPEMPSSRSGTNPERWEIMFNPINEITEAEFTTFGPLLPTTTTPSPTPTTIPTEWLIPSNTFAPTPGPSPYYTISSAGRIHQSLVWALSASVIVRIILNK